MNSFPDTIAKFVTQEEAAYRTQQIEVSDNNMWNMSDHIRVSMSMKLGKFIDSSNDLAVKQAKRNIILPILRLRYRLEDIDVKDILLYIDDPGKTHLSFLVKKYWDDVFLIENDFDGFLDRMHQDPIDFGGGLVKDDFLPEVIPLQRIAFCDQTNILGGPIALRYNFSPDELRAKAKQGWGDTANGATLSIDNLIILAKKEKKPASQREANKNKIPGKNVEVYVVRGEMPETYLGDTPNVGDEKLTNQLQIIAFYTGESTQKEYQILYRKEEKKQVYKFYNPEEIFGRGLGIGGVEELFDAQMWTDFAQIAKNDMLKAASKNVIYTDDEAYATRNKNLNDLDNLELTSIKKGATINQVPVASPNIQLFVQAFQEWEGYAKEVAGSTEALEGKQPASGTPFRLQERVVFEGKGLHRYRQGRYAKFIEQIIRDWIIPRIEKEIVKGKKFLANFSADEMQFLMERIASNRASKAQLESILNGRIPEDFEMLKQKEQEKFLRGGNQRIIEILQDELKDVHLKVKINIAGKQKDISLMVDKLVNVVRQYLSTPQMSQDPFALKLIHRIMEASGLPIEDFPISPIIPPQQQGGASPTATNPIRQLVSSRERQAITT